MYVFVKTDGIISIPLYVNYTLIKKKSEFKVVYIHINKDNRIYKNKSYIRIAELCAIFLSLHNFL